MPWPASTHRPGLQPALREGADQVDELPFRDHFLIQFPQLTGVEKKGLLRPGPRLCPVFVEDRLNPRSLGRNGLHCLDLNDVGLGIQCAGELDLLSRVLFGHLLIV
jgi:hypothetical protein